MSMPERRDWTLFRNEELQEDDVWGSFHERKEFAPKAKESTPSTLRRVATASKMIPTSNKNPNQEKPKMNQNSAPVNIPDWSKIYGTTTSKYPQNPPFLGNNYDQVRTSWDSDGEEEQDEVMVPPHEWLARKLSRSQISSFSVCEGVGRTLKGRDLSSVRNAVLTKTGFLE